MATPYGNAYVPKVTFKSVSATAAAIATVTQLVYSFTIQNPSSATGVLYVGGSNVDSTASITLSAGDSFEAPMLPERAGLGQYDLAGWYLRASVATVKAKIFKIVKGQGLQ